MGLFSFLKTEKLPFSDKVWKMKSFAVKGLMTDALIALKTGDQPVVTSFFQDGVDLLKEFILEQQVPHQIILSNSDGFNSKIVLVLSHELIRSRHLSFKNIEKVRLLILGHYPLPEKELNYLSYLTKSPDVTITFYSSLEDEVMKPFNPERMMDIMNKLGMRDDEAIEHDLVTKSMERAREKIQNLVRTERESNIEREWFARNLPEKF